jgi:hypothetical protein
LQEHQLFPCEQASTAAVSIVVVEILIVDLHLRSYCNITVFSKDHSPEKAVTHTPANGPRNTVYPDMNDKNPGADDRISHGQSAHPPSIAQIIWPRMMLTYLGNIAIKSLAALRLFADILVPIMDIRKLNEAKNAAALLSQRSMRRSGSHSSSSYIIRPAEVTAIPTRIIERDINKDESRSIFLYL